MSSSLKSCCNYIPQRWVFTILASTGLCLQSLFSVIMSISIIEMVAHTESLVEQVNQSCPSFDNDTPTNKTIVISQIEDGTSIERFSWDEYTQGVILSSFSWSSTIMAFFYGTLAERFGGKHILGFAIFAQAVLTFITPFLIIWNGSTALIITRVLIGLGTDGLFSVVSTMIPHWSSLAERTRIGNAVYTGAVLGLFFATIVPALIIAHSGMGWPAVFHFFGIVGIIWCLLWITFVYENPDVHPFISEKEFEYLRNSSNGQKKKRCKLPPPPWKHIFLCKEFWAFTIIYSGSNWAFFVMVSGLPRYMGNVIRFPIESNGFFSSLPYIMMWLTSMGSAWVSDKILEKQWISLTNARKIFSTLSTVGPGIFLLLASYAECDKTVVVFMFMIGITLIGNFASLMMNPIDLSPNYAGSIMSAGSGVGQSVSIIAPYLIGVLVPNSTIAEWRIVFWIVFLSATISNIVYLVWFKAEVQPWNEPKFVKDRTKSAIQKEEVELKLMS